MNPTHGVLPHSEPAECAVAIDPFPGTETWPGLAVAARRIGIDLDAEAFARFERYRDLLLLRTAQFNLTAIRDPAGIEQKLFLDALAMLPALDAAIAGSPGGVSGHVTLIDVGSGGGFPGLPLKIARPGLAVTLLDATAKKTTFLNEVISELGLDAARAVQGRAEDVGRSPEYRERFDCATARAVSSLPVLVEYVLPLIRVGGTALLPKGLQIDEELLVGRRAAAVLGARIVSAERLPVAGTRLIAAVKERPTPAKYPRSVGIPSRSPLDEGS